jgi:ribosomal protein S18 acetylase RimI-like enzyme
MDGLTSRIASERDLAELLRMMEDFNRVEGTPWEATLKERAVRKLLADSSLGLICLLDAPSGVVGYFVVTWGFDLEWDGRDAFLTELFLITEARGKKLGGPALAHAEALSHEHGARALHLMVRYDNLPAQRLYARHGFSSPPRLFLTKAF